jgi:hypothetical protein
MKSVMSVVSRPAPPSLRLQSSEPNLKQAVSNPPPLPPQHLTLPNSPYARALNQSTPSFNSSHYSQQSQSTLSLTPPLSRSSSPGTRYQSTISTSSSEDLGSPPSSVSLDTIKIESKKKAQFNNYFIFQ